MSKQNIIGALACVAMASVIPFALVARSRSMRSGVPGPHLILDMAKQAKFKAQRDNPMFADDREERPVIPGTLAEEDLIVRNENSTDVNGERVVNNGLQIDHPDVTMVIKDGDTYDRVMLGQAKNPLTGKADYVTQIPAPFVVTTDFVHRGQERFNIYCAPCHGQTGYGDGMVAARALEYQTAGNIDAAGSWVQPSNYHKPEIMVKPVGSIFNTITNGIRNMPRYDKQISVADRWAIVAYVKALQFSQGAPVDQLPDDLKQKLQASGDGSSKPAVADASAAAK